MVIDHFKSSPGRSTLAYLLGGWEIFVEVSDVFAAAFAKYAAIVKPVYGDGNFSSII